MQGCGQALFFSVLSQNTVLGLQSLSHDLPALTNAHSAGAHTLKGKGRLQPAVSGMPQRHLVAQRLVTTSSGLPEI